MNAAPIRLAEFISSFSLGGGEIQFVELLRALPSYYEVRVAALSPLGQLFEPVRSLGQRPEIFGLRGSVIQANTLAQVWRFAGWLRKNRIELVHAHDLYSALLAVPAAKLARCKVVVGRLDLVHWNGKLRRAALQTLSRAADHLVANAAAIRNMLIDEERIAADRVSVIYNGIDVSQFDRQARLGEREPLPDTAGSPVAILVANMNDPVKRQEDFLAALALARQRVPSLKAFLVGDGSRRPELERLSAQLELQAAAYFLGMRNDVPAVLAKGTLAVLCSDKEGLSNAVMEGMAARLPMVVTNTGGNPELVKHGSRGFVVPTRQPAELAGAMLRLLEDREAARRMGAAGRDFVEKEMSLGRMVSAHDALYQRLVRV